MRWQWRRAMSDSWRVDATYIKVKGKWAYLYRAVDKLGNTIDFYLSPTRDPIGEKRMIERIFGIGPCVMAEAVSIIEECLAAA